MPVNLVSLVKQILEPNLVSKIASGSGVELPAAQKAIGAAVPSILAGLAGAASKTEGANALVGAIAKQDSGLLANLASALDGSGQSSVASGGTAALGGLLGVSSLGALAGAIAKFAGIGESSAKSLLGVVVQVVLAALGQQQKSQGLDARGLAGLLAAQKDNIAAAMPTGFSTLLGSTNLLDGIMSSSKPGSSSTTATTPAARSTASARSAAGGRRAEPVQMPVARHSAIWLAGLAAITALLAWNWFSDKARQDAPTPSPIKTTAAPSQKIMVGAVDLGGQVGAVIDGLKSSLGSIRDVGTAQAALPKLRDAGTQLEKVQATPMTAEAKKAVAALAAPGLQALAPMMTSVLALPGVGPVARPALDIVRSRLEVLAKG